MKKLIFLIPALILLQACNKKTGQVMTTKTTTTTTTTAPTPAMSSDVLKNEMDSISYAYGLRIGRDLFGMEKTSGEEFFNDDKVKQGIQDGLDEKGEMSNEMLGQLIQDHQQTLMEAKRIEDAKKGEKNKLAGEKFLMENKNKPGVKTTASGLQYKVIKEGEGTSPTASDKVNVHYEGKLLNGDVFDSSYKRGEPISFALGGVIPGWTEGLQLMKPGAKYTFFIPQNLAYGARGAGAQIGPYSTLIFDVELLGVE